MCSRSLTVIGDFHVPPMPAFCANAAAIGSLSPSGARTSLKSHIRPSPPGILPCRPPFPTSSTGRHPRPGSAAAVEWLGSAASASPSHPRLVEQRLREIDCRTRTSLPHEGRSAPLFPYLFGDVGDGSQAGAGSWQITSEPPQDPRSCEGNMLRLPRAAGPGESPECCAERLYPLRWQVRQFAEVVVPRSPRPSRRRTRIRISPTASPPVRNLVRLGKAPSSALIPVRRVHE